MAKVKIENKNEKKQKPLTERWAGDDVPFRVFRDGKWINAKDLKKEE